MNAPAWSVAMGCDSAAGRDVMATLIVGEVDAAHTVQLTDQGTRLVIVFKAKPPVIVHVDYPGGPAAHASYIAASQRAKSFVRGSLALARGHHLEPVQRHGKPALQLIDPTEVEPQSPTPVPNHQETDHASD